MAQCLVAVALGIATSTTEAVAAEPLDGDAPTTAQEPTTDLSAASAPATPAAPSASAPLDEPPEYATRWWDPNPPPPPREPRPPRLRPRYRPEDELSARRRGLGFRGATVGLAGQVVWGRFLACPGDGTGDCTNVGTYLRAQGTPTLDLLAEFGGRWLRFALGAYTSPVPMGFEDWGTAILFGVRAGMLVGNELVRAGGTAGGGYLGWQAHGHLFVMPWRSARGHRVGFALAAGAWNWLPSVCLGLRIAPAAMNHRGGRRAAIERARADASAGSR